MDDPFLRFDQNRFHWQVQVARIRKAAQGGRTEKDAGLLAAARFFNERIGPQLEVERQALRPLLSTHPDDDGVAFEKRLAASQRTLQNASVALAHQVGIGRDGRKIMHALADAMELHEALVCNEILVWVRAHVDEDSLQRMAEELAVQPLWHIHS